jgi:putative membrane protein
MMDGFDGVMGTVGWLWMLIPLLFWGGLLALIVWAVVRIFPERRGGERSEIRDRPSEEILRERFDRGEMNAEEYERSLSVIGERDPLKGGI